MIKKIAKLIRGAASPAAVFRACLLGVMLGMVPGFNLTSFLLIAALLLFNHSLLIGGIALAIGKALCHLLAPLTFHIGYFIIHGMGLEGLFRAFSETPGLALMDLHVYCLIGGLPVALILGGGSGYALARALTAIRSLLAKAGESSERLQRLMAKRIVRIGMWILLGKQKASMAELVRQKSPLFRKSGLILVALVIVIAVAAQVLLSGTLLKNQMERNLSGALGAEVNVRSASLSLLGGRIEIDGLQITDAKDPNLNAVQAERIAAEVSVAGLLTKRVVVSELTVINLQTGARRDRPGWVAPKKEQKPTPPASMPGLEDAEPLLAYFKDRQKTDKYMEYLRKAREKLAEFRQRSEGKADQKQQLKEEAQDSGYLSLSAAHLLAKRPRVTIRKLTIGKIKAPQRDAVYDLDGSEVSSDPELNDQPMTMKLTGTDGLLAFLRLDYQTPAKTHQIELNIPNIDLSQATLSEKSPVQVQDGRADVHAKGEFREDMMLVPVTIRIRDFKGSARPGRGVLGMGSQDSQKAFQYIKDFELHLILSGTIDQPQLTVNGEKTLASIKDALVKAGQRELANRAGEQLQKFVGKTPLPAGLSGLLGGMGKPTTKPASGQPPRLPDILPGLGPKPKDADANKDKKPGLLDGLLK